MMSKSLKPDAEKNESDSDFIFWNADKLTSLSLNDLQAGSSWL